MNEHLFKNTEEVVAALAEAISMDLSHQLSVSGAAGMAVGGGKTPAGLYDQLSKAQLDWSNVVVTLTDERWVDNEQPDSNERMVKQHLLQNLAASATFVPLKTADKTAEAGQHSLEQRMQDRIPSVDVVVLGMGSDGHFASLFPKTAELRHGLDVNNPSRCIATTSPLAPTERISLTLSMLLTAKKIYLFITGREKLNVYKTACLDQQTEGMPSLPITAVLKQSRVPVEVFWAPTPSLKDNGDE